MSIDFNGGERNGLGRREKRPKSNRKEREKKQKSGRWEKQDEKGEGRMSSKMPHECLIGLTSYQGPFIFMRK